MLNFESTDLEANTCSRAASIKRTRERVAAGSFEAAILIKIVRGMFSFVFLFLNFALAQIGDVEYVYYSTTPYTWTRQPASKT